MLYHLMKERNSSLVRGSSRNTPSIELVIVLFWILFTPRIVIHMCLEGEAGFIRTYCSLHHYLLVWVMAPASADLSLSYKTWQ